MNDNDNEDLTAEEIAEKLKAVAKRIEDVIAILDSAEETDEALQIMASVLGTFLCFRYAQESEAREAYSFFMEGVEAIMQLATERNMTMWVGEETPH